MLAEARAESRGQVKCFQSLDTEMCYCHSDTAWTAGSVGIQGVPERKAYFFALFLARLMFLGGPEAGRGGCGQQVVFVSPLFPRL